MSDRLSLCTWPKLPAPFDAALRDATRYAFDEVHPIGIVATGTIVRGQGDASSDLDIYVVQRFFNGVPAEIFINPPHTIRMQEELTRGRPARCVLVRAHTRVEFSVVKCHRASK